MATSLTNNVLTFDHGSIKDVVNEVGVCFPLSFNNRSYTFGWDSTSSSTATISGSIGEVKTAVVRCNKGGTAKITSNGGTWLYRVVADFRFNVVPNGHTQTTSLSNFPWNQSGASIGSVNYSYDGTYYGYAGVIAYRLY